MILTDVGSGTWTGWIWTQVKVPSGPSGFFSTLRNSRVQYYLYLMYYRTTRTQTDSGETAWNRIQNHVPHHFFHLFNMAVTFCRSNRLRLTSTGGGGWGLTTLIHHTTYQQKSSYRPAAGWDCVRRHIPLWPVGSAGERPPQWASPW